MGCAVFFPLLDPSSACGPVPWAGSTPPCCLGRALKYFKLMVGPFEELGGSPWRRAVETLEIGYNTLL